jgi:hypothetical protein
MHVKERSRHLPRSRLTVARGGIQRTLVDSSADPVPDLHAEWFQLVATGQSSDTSQPWRRSHSRMLLADWW